MKTITVCYSYFSQSVQYRMLFKMVRPNGCNGVLDTIRRPRPSERTHSNFLVPETDKNNVSET